MTRKPGDIIEFGDSSDVRKSFLDTILVGDDSGVYLSLRDEDLSDIARFQEHLVESVSHLYTDGMFFDSIDRKNLETLLYGTLEDIQSLMDGDHRIHIAQSLREIPDTMRKIHDSLFHGTEIRMEYDDGMDFPLRAKYHIAEATAKDIGKNIRLLLGDSCETNPFSLLNSGFLHAYFWMHGIRYFGASDFLEAIEGQKVIDMVSILSQRGGIIALGERGSQTKDDTVIQSIEPKIITSPLVGSDGAIDPLRKRCSLPKIASGKTIFQIIPGYDGSPGLSVRGEAIDNHPAQRILPQDMFLSPLESLSQYISVRTEENGAITISALENIYILEIGGKYSINLRGKYVGNVGMDSDGDRKVTRPSLVFAKDDIIEYVGNIGHGFSIAAGGVSFRGESHGKIQTNTDIRILEGSSMLGSLYSHIGNIYIEEGVRTDRSSSIAAYNGKVECDGNMVGATICADEVIIRGIANRCRIFARKVQIERNAGSQIFAEEFHIHQDIGAEASEYHVLMYADAEKIPVYLQSAITSLESSMKQEDSKSLELLSRLRAKQEADLKSNIILVGKPSPSAMVRIVIVPFSLDHEYYDTGVLKGGENRSSWFESLNTGKMNYRSIPVVDRKTRTDMTRKQLPAIIHQMHFSSTSALATTESTPVFQKKIYIPARIDGKTEKMFLFSFSDSGEIVFVLQATPKNDEYLKTLTVNSTVPIVLDGVGDFSVQVRATITERSVWKLHAQILDDQIQKAIRLVLSEKESKGNNK